MPKREELQQIESKPLETGRFEIALKEIPIYKLTSIEELEKVLRYCMVLVGLRASNLPGKEEKAILINHIQKYYSGHSIAEIKLAFDMAVNGELNIQHSEVVCYENFSILYFCNIMNVYREWAVQQWNFLKSKEEEQFQTILTDEQLEDIIRKDIEDKYQQMRNGRVPYGLPDYLKEILVKDGLMKQEDDLASFFVQRLGKGIENIYVPA